MSYTTWEMIVGKYPGVAKNANSPEVALAFLPGAEGEINGRLAAKYTVPFSPVPALIQDLCTDLVYAKLTIRDPKLSEIVMKYYDKRMEGLQDGTTLLVYSTGTTLTNASNAATIDKDYHSVFGPDDAENWQPDTDALDDAEDVRSDD